MIEDDAVDRPVMMPAQIIVRQPQFNPEQIDQWVFNRWGGADASKARLEANLELRIDDLCRACSMTELQKKKLKLAGLGDVKRFYDRVEDLKRKYTVSASASQPNFNVNNIWQEMQPLQIELNNGFFNDDSLFMKTVKNTLNADQAKRYDDLIHHRAAERHGATVELFVTQLDKALGLSQEKRVRLSELLVSEVPPPVKFGQADYWYLMYQMTRLPEAKIKAILDEPQWRLLSRQFLQARGMEPWLRGNGLLARSEPLPSPPGGGGAVEKRRQGLQTGADGGGACGRGSSCGRAGAGSSPGPGRNPEEMKADMMEAQFCVLIHCRCSS